MNVQTTLHPYGWQNLDHLVTVNAWMCSNWGFVRAGLGEAGFTAAHARLAHRAPSEIIAAATGEPTP